MTHDDKPAVGMSENLGILPGGYFARLLSGGGDKKPPSTRTAFDQDRPLAERRHDGRIEIEER